MSKPGDAGRTGPVAPGEWWSEHDFGTGTRQSLRVRPVHSEKTPYQEMQIFESDQLGRVLVLDGIVQTTQADEFMYHEMIVNVPLLGRPGARTGSPASVLIIGGGDGGALREVLRHDGVERAVMVEIDRAVVEASARYVGINGDYDDPRAELVIGDGSAFVKSAAARERPFDVVIIDSTDPVGPGELLFTDEFMRDLAACMTDDGVMVRQSGLPFSQGDVLGRVVAQARRVFGRSEVFRVAVPTYYSGDMAFVVGLAPGQSLRTPHREWVGRYYNPEIHAAAFALPTWIRDLVEPRIDA
jgi:spermidine synthase